MIINVTQQHIDEGECGSLMCPIALAIRDSLHVVNVMVAFTNCRVLGQLYALSSEAIQFIISFDTKQKVEPFSFDLDLETPCSSL